MFSSRLRNKIIVIVAYIILVIFLVVFTETTKFIMLSAGDYNDYDISTQHNDFKRAISSYNEISNILEKVLAKYNVDSVLLYRLHKENYGIDLNGGLLVSVANMKSSSYSNLKITDVSNIPAPTFSYIFPVLLEGANIDIVTDEIPSGALKELLQKEKSAESEWVPLLNENLELIGILNLNWNKNGHIAKSGSQEYADMVSYLTNTNKELSKYFSLPHVPDSK